jgi:serine/threonine protein kinase
MDPGRWRQIEQLYHAALEKEPGQRALFLEHSCAGDPSLRKEIESLLSFADHADGYLKAVVQQVASQASDVGAAPLPQPALVTGPPQQLGRYQLLEQIGKGGMGVVYRATDPAIGRTVAIKTIVLDDTVAETSELRARLLRESQAGGRLSHQNIVAVHDVIEQGNTAYIVMEYVAGRSLQQAISDDSSLRSTGEMLRIVQQCAEALDYAHSRGVVHRDIKPANIMLQHDGSVKIADFGIAKVAQFSPLTQSATTIGSPHYMAPEQWKGEMVTGQTDQYALAAVAYVMLTGRKPFEGETVASLAAQTLYQEPPAATSYNSQLSPVVDGVLHKALSKTAAARYETCSAFAGALRKAWEHSLGPAFVVPRKSNWLAVAVVATIVAALATGAWLYHQRNSAAQVEMSKAQWEAPKNDRPPIDNLMPSLPQSKQPGKSNGKQTRRVDSPPSGDSYALAEALLKRGAYADAVPYFSKAIAIKPDYRAYFGRAGAHQRMEHPEQAIADYSQAIRFKPDSAMAYHDRAVCEARLNRNDRAFADYNRALELAPDNPRTWNGRGVIYLRRKEYEKAIPDFTEAIRLRPAFVQAYENRAAAKKALRDTVGANSDLNQARALKQQPSNQ